MKYLGMYRLFVSIFLVPAAFGQDLNAVVNPPVLLRASDSSAKVTVRQSLGANAKREQFSLGALTNDQKPDRNIVPTIDPGVFTVTDKEASFTVKGLIPFGLSTVPLLVDGQVNQTIRFQKPGLTAKPTSDGGFSVLEGENLFVVVENTTEFDYKQVRARFRFQDVDVCKATADKTSVTSAGGDACEDPNQWVSFAVPKYSPVTLRVPPAKAWFLDATTRRPRAAKRKGVLSLRYTGDKAANENEAPVYEQSIPLEVQFDPDNWSASWNLVRIFVLLTLGALAALVLRVTIPNYRRKSGLKEQLGEAAKATRAISQDVESTLRVLLRVERLNLDAIRKSAWISGPSFNDHAQRIEQGLQTLKRRIEWTRRLDTSRGRHATLYNQNVAPTRVRAIDRELGAASEILQRDQLSDQDWVFIQQRLEAADKLLRERTQEEKDGFLALLSQRWKDVSKFFAHGANGLTVPASLQTMAGAFPPQALLPAAGADGTEWVASAGHVRADLQLSALEALRDCAFLGAASVLPANRVSAARDRLALLLATPSVENLQSAQRLVEELQEGVDAETIEQALRAGEAMIEMTPDPVQPFETARLSVCFKNPRLNTAAATQEFVCEWSFASEGTTDFGQLEHGWTINHFFTDNAKKFKVKVQFYRDGKPVNDANGQPAQWEKEVVPQPHSGGWTVGSFSERAVPELLQLLAALAVPLVALAMTQADQGTSGQTLQLIGVGFGSETIRAILTGTTPPASTPTHG